MYIHLGRDVSLKVADIIGIFDMETSTVSKDTRSFLKKCEENNLVTNVSDDLPKCFVLSRYNGEIQLFVSAISSSTLKKRTTRFTNRQRSKTIAQ